MCVFLHKRIQHINVPKIDLKQIWYQLEIGLTAGQAGVSPHKSVETQAGQTAGEPPAHSSHMHEYLEIHRKVNLPETSFSVRVKQ